MTTLGNYHYDFPRLAKQSGFNFQLHRGDIKWTDIENLNVNDIVENKNFHLLEKNLINVINCNLEKEFNLEVLDQNLVKLFKLAQLGVDYLSYCETYLDKCVVILQEQLITFQEEYQLLKYEKEEMKKEGRGSKQKDKAQSYPCQKCEKAFISDVYLKFHDKRRHSNPNTKKRSERSRKTFVDVSQQTEEERKLSTFTQTVLFSDKTTITKDNEDTGELKMRHLVKIENLEQELQDLKKRLRKAENALRDKIEAPRSNEYYSSFPGSLHHNTMLLVLPSYQAQPGNAGNEVNATYQESASEICQPKNSLQEASLNPKAIEKRILPENTFQLNNELKKEIVKEENELPKDKIRFYGATKGVEDAGEEKGETEEHREYNKENVNPNKEKGNVSLNTPLPPPRRLKKVIHTQPDTENSQPVGQPFATPRKNVQSKLEVKNCNSQAITVSTPINRKSDVENSSDIFEEFRESNTDISKRESTSKESLNSKKSDLIQNHSNSFIKSIAKRNSPKLRNFRKTLRSLTNLCDSVSSTGKDLIKKESANENIKATIVDGLNINLRQMGIDPEWTGIPKKTMKQKLKALKHRRKLLAKENPMYMTIRKNIEEKILYKLKQNFKGRKNNFKKKLKKQESMNTEDLMTPDPRLRAEGDAKTKRCVMYDIGSDCESQTSDSESHEDVENSTSHEAVEFFDKLDREKFKKEFDLTVFQVGRGSFNKIAQKEVPVKVDALLTDSDIDCDFLDHTKLQSINGLTNDKRKDERMNDEDEGHQLEFFLERPGKGENQSILKGTDGFQRMNAKKKVLFINNSNDIEEGLSDSPTEDDNLWSLKSNWEKDVS